MSRRALVIATRNPHKLREILAGLHGLEVELRSCDDFPGCPEVVEDGDTLESNAAKKAREVCAFTAEWTLADDTGLEVAALGGAPGVFSARWAGPGCTYDDNNAKLLRELASLPTERRTARFRCVMALAIPGPASPAPTRAHHEQIAPDGVAALQLFEGRIDGRITDSARGSGGFGYDPLFHVPQEGCTLAEIPTRRKNAISHRALALRALRNALTVELQRSERQDP